MPSVPNRSKTSKPGNSARSIPFPEKKTTTERNGQAVKRLSALSESEFNGLRRGVLERAVAPKEERSRPLPFPVDVFPQALKRLVLDGSTALPCPPDYIALPTLVVVGSFIGAGRPLRIKSGWEERAVIYGAIVGHTGSRKSPALEHAMAPARRRDSWLSAQYEADLRTHKEKQRQARIDKEEFSDAPPVPQQHVTTDTTVEALADVLRANPRLLVYRDELTGLVASLNQYKGGKGADKQFWLSAWSSQDYTVNRKGQDPLRIARPFLSVIGNIPPDMLGDLADRRGREDGFIDRILFAYPDPVTVNWTDGAADSKLQDAYVNACLKIGKLPDATLKLSAAAKAEFSVWFDEHNRTHDGPGGSWAKMDGYCARLASIVHHLRWAYKEIKSADEVDVESVRRATTLIAYFKNHAIRALGRMKSGRDGQVLARLLAFVINAPDYRVHPRALIGAQIAPNADEAKAMLERLAAMGIGEVRIGEGRRKDEVVFQGRNDLEEIAGQFESGESA